ncbi:MAG: NUDIX domain-containing protein [Proteobacteria bacterium]|nr:NUDIX domain-containing protein [Pseudomonadota bacterium]
MNKLQPKFSRADTEVVSREICHRGFLQLDRLRLRHRLFAGPWSKVIDRELLVKGQAVGVLLFDPAREEVVLVRQFRVGMIDEKQSPWLLELVAGMVGENEDLLEVARREAEEESNCSPKNLRKICSYYNSPGTSNERLSLFCGQVDAGNAGGVFGLSEEHEDIQVVVLSVNELFAAVESGLINNAMTIIASQWLQLHKEELVQRWK